jgi:CheY-like chemotaxis protein
MWWNAFMKPTTVLLVDDERSFLQVVDIILRSHNYQPVLARDADEALDVLETQLPDIIVLDDNMPGLDGGELCFQLKSQPHTAHIPVLLCSAGERVRDQSYIDAVLADGVLRKPVMPNDLVFALERLLPTA